MDKERYGEVPTRPCIFAACDSKYFMKFAPAFVESIRENCTTDKAIHIHVMNPDEQVFALACYLNSQTHNPITYTFSDSDLSKYNDEEKRALYACLRFMVLPCILNYAGKVLVLDIDCLIMNDFEFPKKPIGYFPREPLEGTQGWERIGTKVAAGCFYIEKSAMPAANAIVDVLEKLPVRWFNDQIALSTVIGNTGDEFIHDFNSNFMDWEFLKGTTIWTGKGPRKYDNKTYVDQQNKFHDAIMNYDLERVYEKVILAPRLDIPFKKFGLCMRGSVAEPIREHWKNFVESKVEEGYTPVIAPRWMFNVGIEEYFPNARLLVPHVEQHNWGGKRSQYYMQTVFPWLFTVDPLGWAGGAQYIATFDSEADYDPSAYHKMQDYIAKGSKFQHLQGKTTNWDGIDKGFYILVPLQLPHDDTIKFHSDFSVEEFVTSICQWVVDTDVDYQIVFKGHPVNVKSMEPLKEIIEKFREDGDQRVKDRLTYIEQGNFHELVNNSVGMFVLNGGSGQEAMLLEKPVVCFGKCDYAPAVIQGNIDDIEGTYKDMISDDWTERKHMFERWFDWYVNQVCIDTKA